MEAMRMSNKLYRIEYDMKGQQEHLDWFHG